MSYSTNSPHYFLVKRPPYKPGNTVMTPELKSACETVFQEHKTFTQSITWSKDAFQGRISIGLREMAKETLVSKNVIYFPNRAKKTVTVLNPAVTTATSYEQAIEMAESKIKTYMPVVAGEEDSETPIPAYEFTNEPVSSTRRLIKITGQQETVVVAEKWYLRPVFYYIIWPACAAGLGVLITWLMSEWVAMSWR